MLAWEDPYAEFGAISPFWAVVPMMVAVAGPRVTPLAGDARAPGLSIVGLRLTDGSLVLKLERGGAAAQFRLEPGAGFEESDGVLTQHDLLAVPRGFVSRLRAARAVAVGESPRQGRGRATVTC